MEVVPTAFWAFFGGGTPDAGPGGLSLADKAFRKANQPLLQGRTEDNETCRCLPSDLKTPPGASDLMKQFRESVRSSRAVRAREFRKMVDKVAEHQDLIIADLEEHVKKQDQMVLALSSKAAALEAAGSELSEAFRELRDAHEASGCKRVLEDAQANNEELPKCQELFEEATREFKALQAKAQPSCKAGAVTLVPLRDYSRRMQPPSNAAVAAPLAAASLGPSMVAAALAAAAGAEAVAVARAPGHARRRRQAFEALGLVGGGAARVIAGGIAKGDTVECSFL